MDACFNGAIKNIAVFGDTDIFPYSFEQHLFHDCGDLVRIALHEIHRNFDTVLAKDTPDNITTLAPVGYTGFRWATQLDPLWNAYFLALVLKLAPAIEAARVPSKDKCVFSYRYAPTEADGRLFAAESNWHSFMSSALLAAETYPFVMLCDIADFYPRIYHHRIENALKGLRVEGDVVHRILRLLQTFSGSVSYGLPVGGPASRLLAELGLNGTDKLLRAEGVRFIRFVDDYRFFCRSREEAYQCLILLSEKLLNEGLSLNKNKTRILTAKEFKAEVKVLVRSLEAPPETLTDEDRLLRLSTTFDPYSETRVTDYEALQAEVAKIDVAGILGRELEKTQIDPNIARRAISALRVMEPTGRKNTLLNLLQPGNLATLAPVFPKLMMVLRGLYEDLDPEAQDVVDKALIGLVVERSHITRVDLNLAYLLQVLRHRSSPDKEALYVQLFKERSSPLVRREIILAMAAWGHHYWLTDIKRDFIRLTKWERRAFIVGSYYLMDEGKHWRTNNKSSFYQSEELVREWFGARFQTNTSVPQ